MRLSLWRTCLLLAVAVCAATTSVFAQATITSALLRGTVVDQTGASVPKALVTVTDESKGVSQKSQTDGSGRYLFTDLRPGTYTVIVEVQGFKAAHQRDVTLFVGQQADLNIKLEVGSVTTSINVEGETSVLNTVSAAMAQNVETKLAIDLPLLDRQITNLAMLTPGITGTNGGGGYAVAGTGGIGYSNINFSSNGQRNSTAEARLDGAPATTPETGGGGVNLMPYTPSPEIVQEFRMQTSSFSAEYGSNGGTVMSIVTKSGTNTFHGSAFYFLRRPEMDANSFFGNLTGTPKTDYKRDNFGGTITGPIRKNKLFFLFSYDKVMFDSPNSMRTTVPNDLQKAGNFSQTLNSDGSLRQVFNPRAAYQEASGNWVRPGFAGNIVPGSMMDATAANLIALYPAGNVTGDPNTGFNNFYKAGVDTVRISTYDFKLDYYINEKQRISGRYSYHPYLSTQATFGLPPAVDGGNILNLPVQNTVIEHTWTLSPTMIWSNRISWNRRNFHDAQRQQPDPAEFGLPPQLVESTGMVGMPLIYSGQYMALGNPACCVDTRDGSQLYAASSTISKTRGNHNIKLGGEVQWWLENYWQPGIPDGVFSFGADRTTQAVFGGASGQGDALASMQLGFAGWTEARILPGTSTKSNSQDIYFQDDWRVNDKLTVNLGVRYEWTTPFTERYNRTGIADWNADSGVNVPGVGEIKGVMRLVDSSNRSVSPDRNNIGPRIGFAYRLGDKTVIRGGAGLYYGITTPGQNNWYTGPQYRAYSDPAFSLDGGITQNLTLSNPWPNGLTQPQGSKYGKMAMWGFGADNSGSFSSDPIHNSEIYQWNIGVQRQLSKSMSLEVSYAANRATHLVLADVNNRNFLPEAAKQQNSLQDLGTNVPNPFQYLFVGPKAIFSEPTSLYNNATIPRDWLLRPYPQFQGTFAGSNPMWGTSTYNALQIKLERRFSGGLSLIAHYTVAKQMDNSSTGQAGWMAMSAGYQDPNNLMKGEWSNGMNDVPQRLMVAGVYELPFGRGKRFGSQVNKVLDGFVGGWQTGGIMTLQSGFPLHVTMANGRLSDGTQRPNYSGGGARSNCSVKSVVSFACTYFNDTVFSDPGEQQYGSSPRFIGSLRAPGVANLDLSLFKYFAIGEKRKIQLRAEAFNSLNRTMFAAPSTGWCSTGDCGFGQITGTANDPRKLQMGARFEF